MALINCPECGKQISDMATSCPECGYPLQKSTISNHQHLNDYEIENEVKRLIDEGKEIYAVKYYKDNMNCGLKEAKDKVDSLRGITPSANKGGCASIILIFILISSILLYII
jgi:ribosomal protein L7/L12